MKSTSEVKTLCFRFHDNNFTQIFYKQIDDKKLANDNNLFNQKFDELFNSTSSIFFFNPPFPYL